MHTTFWLVNLKEDLHKHGRTILKWNLNTGHTLVFHKLSTKSEAVNKTICHKNTICIELLHVSTLKGH